MARKKIVKVRRKPTMFRYDSLAMTCDSHVAGRL
jgi:hypothetical protein